MPKLTQTMGPWIRGLKREGQDYLDLVKNKNLVAKLIDEIPTNFRNFTQNFNYSISNWLPFYWRGFEQRSRYTYVIEDLVNIKSVYQNFHRSKKRNIKKAKNIVNVEHSQSIVDEFFDHHRASLRDQGAVISYDRNLLLRIVEACRSNGCGQFLVARDSSDIIHSALFIVWDQYSAFDLISTIDPEYRRSGSASLLVYEAMKKAAEHVNVFDFEGSMIEGVEESFRRFGGIARPYHTITRDSRGAVVKGFEAIERQVRIHAGRIKRRARL